MNFKELKSTYNFKLVDISNEFEIPYRTLQNWISGINTPPDYVLKMLKKLLDNKKGLD